MMDETIIISLLTQAENLLAIRREHREKPGENFNIFSVLDMESDEVNTHCRILYELLRPNGSHGMGDVFLRAFFDSVLKKPFLEDPAIRVYREYKFSGGGDGRIDLVIEGPGFFYPIEAKIYAGDQPLQIARYAAYAAKHAADHRVFYLTLDGHEPSEESLGENKDLDYRCLSFAADIRFWLEKCGALAWEAPCVVAMLQQYIQLLDKLTGKESGDVIMDQIQSLVEKSPESFEGALAIEQAVRKAKEDMMRKVFADMEAYIGDRLPKMPDYGTDYKTKLVTYYDLKGSNYPSLNYIAKEWNGLTVVFRIEVDHRLFFGLAVAGGEGSVQKKVQQLSGAFSGKEWEDILSAHSSNNWWIDWRFLPGDDQLADDSSTLNFRSCKGLYLKLFEKTCYAAIMKDIYAKLDAAIQLIRKANSTN